MPRINVNSNANAVVHSGMTNEGNVEDPPSGGEDPDLFSNANLRQEVSSNVNRYEKRSFSLAALPISLYRDIPKPNVDLHGRVDTAGPPRSD